MERVAAISADQPDLQPLTALVAQLSATLQQVPAFASWHAAQPAMLYFGPDIMAYNVRLVALRDAARDLGIPFYLVFDQDQAHHSAIGARHEAMIVLTPDDRLDIVAAAMPDVRLHFVVPARYYDRSPLPGIAPLITPTQREALSRHAARIAVVISELSAAGGEDLLRGYVRELGLPVMTFPWAANAKRHVPAGPYGDKPVVFLGSYFEKPARIEAYFGDILRRHTHTVIGAGWSTSSFPGIGDTLLQDFNGAAPKLYSGHRIALNIHHAFEVDGYSCNERTFNAIACGGFLVSDAARRVRDFFSADEVVMAETPAAYAELVEHFIAHPDERQPYMQRAQQRVWAEHTYHHRLADLLLAVFAGKPASSHCPILSG